MIFALPRLTVLALLLFCGVSVVHAQKKVNEVTAPLSLTGQLSAGINNFSEDGQSSTSGVSNLNADLTGYWKTPRLVLFDVSPTVTFGNTQGISGVGGPYNGFASSMTLLGGSAFPFTVSYSRFQSGSSNQTPGSVFTESSSRNSSLGFDWQLNVRNLPTLKIDYTNTDADSEFIGVESRGFATATNVFRVDSTYRIEGWDLDGGYRRSKADRSSPDPFDVSGEPLSSNQEQDNLNVSARKSLTKDTQFSTYLNRLNSDYTYRSDSSQMNATSAQASLVARPSSKLTTSANAQYLRNTQSATSYSDSAGSPAPITASAETDAFNFGGGAGYQLGHGLSLQGGVGLGKSLTELATGGTLPWNIWWTGGANYGHQLPRNGYFGLGYVYQQTMLSVIAGPKTNANSHNISGNIGGHAFFGLMANLSGQFGAMRGDAGNGRNYSANVNLTRQIRQSWSVSGDFDYGNSHMELPARYASPVTAYGIRVASQRFQIAARRQRTAGSVFQLPSVLSQSGPQLLLTPTFASNGSVWSSIEGSYHPRGPYWAGVSWGKYSNAANDPAVSSLSLDTGSWYLNGYAGMKLRRLQLAFGYTQFSQLAGRVLARDFGRRTIYFQIIRNFKVF